MLDYLMYKYLVVSSIKKRLNPSGLLIKMYMSLKSHHSPKSRPWLQLLEIWK